jgi:Tol biopolymer transport system component
MVSAAAEPVGFVAVTNGSGSLQISQFGLDGTVVRRLTTGPVDHNYPSLSPDGRRLLFTGGEEGVSEIYRRDLTAGAPAIRLTSPPLQATSPSWSPDGRSIVYSALLPGDASYQIFIARADGSSPVQLTRTADSGNSQPVFSPDGARIAYINGRPATAAGASGSAVMLFTDRIWVMNADGSHAAPLTAGPRDAYPAWLDRDTVIFAREDIAHDTTRIVSAGLDGREQDQSPSAQRFIEPRPLPGGRQYGATIEEGAALHLVLVSRTDGAPLRKAAPSSFAIERLRVARTEGSSFTLAWILGTPGRGDGAAARAPIAVLALAAAGLLLIVGFGLVAWRKTSAC